jgi:gamma-glutamyltranspeptidase/glutathione hydrolase
VEAVATVRFAGAEIHTCGAWCQGPVLGQALNILDAGQLATAGHNSVDYLHAVVEAMKLAFADREAFYGDPRHVEVPLAGLLDAGYGRARRALIDPLRASPEMPACGAPAGATATRRQVGQALRREGVPAAPPRDTSYICVVDRWGNTVSATPSDVSFESPVVPGTGLVPSSRGSQSWLAEGHPSRVAPGKRPRLTPSPAMAVAPGRFVLPFGTPGGDVQAQAMLQVFLNINVFGMDAQAAVEAPRFATYSYPGSFEPHEYFPGRLYLESRIDDATSDALAGLGHKVYRWDDFTWLAGAVCTIVADRKRGVLHGGADPRRPAYVLGW